MVKSSKLPVFEMNPLNYEPTKKLNVAAQLSIPADNRNAITAPLSLQQQRFWLLDQLSAGNPACNISVRWKLIGPLDLSILKRAIAAVVRRHDILRTHIELVAGDPVQCVEPDSIVELSRTDLRQLEAVARDAEVQHLSELEAHQAFDSDARTPFPRGRAARR